MNIFFLDKDINNCAKYHTDKHVVKMRIELAQMACQAHWFYGLIEPPYKMTHSGHPTSQWVRHSLSNYRYTVNLALELCDELKFRFNTKHQKTLEVLNWLRDNEPMIEDIGFTHPPLAMPDDSKLGFIHFSELQPIDWAVINYRNYYINDKQHLFKWTGRNKPFWI